MSLRFGWLLIDVSIKYEFCKPLWNLRMAYIWIYKRRYYMKSTDLVSSSFELRLDESYQLSCRSHQSLYCLQDSQYRDEGHVECYKIYRHCFRKIAEQQISNVGPFHHFHTLILPHTFSNLCTKAKSLHLNLWVIFVSWLQICNRES